MPDETPAPREVRSTLVRLTTGIPIAMILIAALGIRLVRLSDPPLDFHPTRQYRSALLARRLYLEKLPSAPRWQLELARANAGPLVEPPILEYASAVAYRLRGGEDLRIIRLLSILAWLTTGALLHGIARHLGGASGALAAAAFFLLCPFGVEASRSFQPDSLMILLIVVVAAGLLRYGREPRLGVLLPAALVAGLAVFVKAMALFQCASGFAALLLLRRRDLGRRAFVHAIAFALVVVLPAASYYVRQWLQGGAVGYVAEQSFIPHLLWTRDFWIGWAGQVWKTNGFVAPVAAAIGIGMLRDRVARALLWGMAAGYVVFVFVFDYQGSTHDYYHLQLIPLVALGLAPLAGELMDVLHRTGSSRVLDVAARVLFAAACLDAAMSGRSRLRAHHFEAEVATDQEVGAAVGHEPSNVLLADNYAYPLKYHGELGGVTWPRWYDLNLDQLLGRPVQSPPDRLRSMLELYHPHFFVVTMPEDLGAQPELASLLENGYARRATGKGYVVYDLTRPLAR